jgi:hypothetical protein
VMFFRSNGILSSKREAGEISSRENATVSEATSCGEKKLMCVHGISNRTSASYEEDLPLNRTVTGYPKSRINHSRNGHTYCEKDLHVSSRCVYFRISITSVDEKDCFNETGKIDPFVIYCKALFQMMISCRRYQTW